MKLVLKNTTGESVTLIIRPDDTFIDLRERVEEELGLCLDLSDIVKGQTYLESQRVLDFFSELSFVEEETLLSHCVSDVECVVPGCPNKKSNCPDKSFFEFPPEEIRNHQWALYCHRLLSGSGKKRLNITSTSRVCADHFKPEQFVKNTTTILKRTAVPCINPELGAKETPILLKSLSDLSGTNEISKGSLFNVPAAQLLESNLVCRLCARSTHDFVHIFDERGKEMGLAKKINACLPISVDIADPYPKQVCSSCCEDLDKCYYFSETSVETHSRLSAIKKSYFPDSSVIIASHFFTENDLELTLLSDRSNLKSCDSCPVCCDGNLLVPEARTNVVEIATKNDDNKPSDNAVPIIIENSKSLATSNTDWESADNAFEYSCQLCSADFRLSSDLLSHSLMHSQAGQYICCLCNNIYSKKIDLETHFSETHNLTSLKIANAPDGTYSHKCETCSLGFKTFSMFANHTCTTINWASNRCNVCHKTFRSEGRLEFHKKFHEKGSKPGYCELCSKTFRDELKLYKHVTYLHGEGKVHCCDECGKVFRSVSTLKYHQRSHQGGNVMKPYSCDVCGKCFIRRSMLRNHVAAAHKTLICQTSCFSCNFCSESFPNTFTVVSHLERVHADKNTKTAFDMFSVNNVFSCEYCKRCFTDILQINLHRSKHRNDMPYECKYCDVVFSSFNELEIHQTNHKSENVSKEYSFDFSVPVMYLCEFCDRSFMSYVKYTEHLTVHYGTHPYTCKYCDEKFSSIEESCAHRSNHVLESDTTLTETNFYRPYECHYCNKSFAIEDALIKHIRMHTGEKPFICDQCGKGFSQSSGLYTHQKVHSSERPYTCPLCPRKFKIKGDRDVHVRKHSGERPYKCEFCGKAFMTQHVYSQHRKIHTGERPYKCDVCGISFRRSHILTVHKRIHTGEKPNACDICGKRYRQRGDMLKHRRIQHVS